MKLKPLTVIDLFAGCGGFTAGFTYPPHQDNPWKVLAGIDFNHNAVETFSTNFGHATGVHADLATIGPGQFLERLGLLPEELDHLHASPPCQDFSDNNRKNGTGSDDKFRIALNWATTFLPKIVTIENVRNFQKAHDRDIREVLELAEYHVTCFELDAADYGVPQHRRRIFYMGVRRSLNKEPYQPLPTHAAPHLAHSAIQAWVTVKQAIGDLPRRRPGQGQTPFQSKINPECPQARRTHGCYACTMRPQWGAEISGHYARPLSQLALDRIKALRPGQAIAYLPPELRPPNGFRGAYGRMHPHRPSKTITTGIRGPSHGPFCHYSQKRLITIREAARLQSFPDSFQFEGPITAQSLLVGNAVPPLLARAICAVSTDLIRGA